MRAVRILYPAALGFVIASSAAWAQDDDASADRRFYVAPMGSYTFADNNRGADSGYGGQIAVGKRLTRFLDAELLGVYTNYHTKASDFPSSLGPQPANSSLTGAGAGVNLRFLPETAPGLYLHLDVMAGQGKSTPGTIRDYTTTLFDAGLGYNIPLHVTLGGLLADGMILRVEGLYRMDAHGKGELGNSFDEQHQYFQEGVLNIGLRIPLGNRKHEAPAAPEAPVEVVPVEQPAAEAPPPAPEAPPCQLPAPGEPVNLDGCKAGDTLVLRGVNFEFDSARLTVNAKTLLDPVADALIARPDIKVEIDGHTDGKGSVPYNQKLSERRAASVVQYLSSRGIDAGRMTAKGFGKSMPVADNATDEGRELNRRVELKITDTGTPAAAAEAPAAAPADAAPAAEAAPPADAGAAPADAAPPADATPPADAGAAPPADAAAPMDSGTPPADAGTPPADGSAPAPLEVSPPTTDSPTPPPADGTAPK